MGKNQLTGLVVPQSKTFMIFLLRASLGYLQKANKTKKCDVFYVISVSCYVAAMNEKYNLKKKDIGEKNQHKIRWVR